MSKHGFSSLELLVVMAICSIAAAAVLPIFSSFRYLQLDYEANYLVSELHWLQEYTQTIQRHHNDFNFIKGDTAPVLRFQAHGYAVSQGTQGNIRPHSVWSEITIERNHDEIHFGQNGDTNPTTIRLWLDGHCRVIFIDRVGRIRLGASWEEELYEK